MLFRSEAWQIYIDGEQQILEELTLAVERRASSNQTKQDIQHRIAHAIRSRLGIRVSVECHDEGSLPRYEGKAVRVHRRSAKSTK